MSKLQDIAHPITIQSGRGSETFNVYKNEDIKDLIRELMADSIKETLDKNQTSASDYIAVLKQKVEDL